MRTEPRVFSKRSRQRADSIRKEVVGKRKMAEGADELSLYIWPELDPALGNWNVSAVLWWLPHMNQKRIKEADLALRIQPGTRLGDLSETEREDLVHWLEELGNKALAN